MTETVNGVTGWTMDTLQAAYAMQREGDLRLEAERDRRYSEVNIEREKALKIKETADLAALGLAREIQTYKDEKANELREQINAERNLYVTKDELASAVRELRTVIEPLVSARFESAGTTATMVASRRNSQWIVTTLVAVLAVFASFGAVLAVVIHH